MSLMQAIIGSAVTNEGGGVSWQYPPPGNLYPVASGSLTGGTLSGAIVGHYETGSIVAPNYGLYRRTYTGNAFNDGSYTNDPAFPASYTQVDETGDAAVGFASDADVAEIFTMEWIGYFKPAVSGDFVFQVAADDYFMMWIGEDAVSGFDNTNMIIQASNTTMGSLALPLTADRYYPVRMRLVEGTGFHNCTIWSGLSGVSLGHNSETAATGQFFYDTESVNGGYPASGLIT